jgi:hypothetical protein
VTAFTANEYPMKTRIGVGANPGSHRRQVWYPIAPRYSRGLPKIIERQGASGRGQFLHCLCKSEMGSARQRGVKQWWDAEEISRA